MKRTTKQFGDFQTPVELASLVVETLIREYGISWKHILEPTCGKGNFLQAICHAKLKPQQLVGIELQPHYVKQAKEELSQLSQRVSIHQASIFDVDLKSILDTNVRKPLLVIGNPPWVTNAELGIEQSKNLPTKRNVNQTAGLAAMTGSSNFDLAEAVWIQLLHAFADQPTTIALLCKTKVAQRVLEYAYQQQLPFAKAQLRKINAKQWFDASVDACLLSVELQQDTHDYQVDVYESLEATTPTTQFAFHQGKLITDWKRYQKVSFLEGDSQLTWQPFTRRQFVWRPFTWRPFTWRQGIKHDAAKVMELTSSDEGWKNGLGENVEIESEYLFPLLKGIDLRKGKLTPNKAVIVPQKSLQEETSQLQQLAPKLWNYLQQHQEILSARKSSIYRNREPFSVFGVGDYSFAANKVMICAFAKQPQFHAVTSHQDKPIFCDDTCYLLPCENQLQAAIIAALYNHPLTQQFIAATILPNSKRPVTKALLQRINLTALYEKISVDDLFTEISGSSLRLENSTKNKQKRTLNKALIAQTLSDLLSPPVLCDSSISR